MIAPADELERRVALAHGFGEINRGSDGLVESEGPAGRSVRRLVAQLPDLQVVRFGMPVLLAFLVIGIVGIGDPVGGFAGVAGAIAFARREETLLAIAREIDAIEGLRAGAPAQIDKLVGA